MNINISQRLEKITTRHRQSERLTPSPLLYTYSLFKINKELLIGEVCPTVSQDPIIILRMIEKNPLLSNLGGLATVY